MGRSTGKPVDGPTAGTAREPARGATDSSTDGSGRRTGRVDGVLDTSDGRERDAPGTTLRRLSWFGALWLAGVGTVSVVAYGIRLMIMP